MNHPGLFVAMSFGNLAGALVAPYGKRSAFRSVLAIALACVAVLAPRMLTRDWPILRTVAAIGLMAGAFRVVSIVMRPDSTASHRALSASFLVVDPRHVRHAPRKFIWDAWLVGLINCAFAIALFWCVSLVPKTEIAIRTLVGGASAYFFVDGVARLVTALTGAVGLDVGPLHDAPITARTVGEFWSRRWNRAVHRLLDAYAFRPVASRFGAMAGVMAAFAASALLHFVPIWVAFDLRHAIPMAAFFIIQGAIVIVEAKLRVTRWPRVFAHVWTLAMFAVTAPLFVEPLLESLGA